MDCHGMSENEPYLKMIKKDSLNAENDDKHW